MIDGLKSSFSAIVNAVMSRVDYYAFYQCKIVSQNADGTYELRPDDSRLGDFSKVPPRYGSTGIAAKVTGGRCLVGWESGDPRRPFATHFEVNGIDKLFLGTAKYDGSDVTEFAAIASKVQTALDDLKSAFNGHTHNVVFGACTAGGTTGTAPSAGPSSTVGTLGPVKTDIVKVK